MHGLQQMMGKSYQTKTVRDGYYWRCNRATAGKSLNIARPTGMKIMVMQTRAANEAQKSPNHHPIHKKYNPSIKG